MRILMTKSWRDPEYLDDMLLNGLRSLYGTDVVDHPRMDHMYADTFSTGTRQLTDLVGRGISLYGYMDDSSVDRTDIEGKIRSGYFDLIIMHSWYPVPELQLILDHTPHSKIVWIDGRDERNVLTSFVGSGHYFKRELVETMDGVHPISFAIPDEKIRAPGIKTKALGTVIPEKRETYIFNDEDGYYGDYNSSLWGVTFCKNGWDCLRHYEVFAAGSAIWFTDIDACPTLTCTTLPKAELSAMNQLIMQQHVATGKTVGELYLRQIEDLRPGMLGKYWEGGARGWFDPQNPKTPYK